MSKETLINAVAAKLGGSKADSVTESTSDDGHDLFAAPMMRLVPGLVTVPDAAIDTMGNAQGLLVGMYPALDGDGLVITGYRSSKLKVAEMADLIEAIYSYGAKHGVRWSDEAELAA